MKLYKPHVFQGSLKKNNYFEGWYYKLVDTSQNLSLCLIPGVALDGDPHGFIQYADTITGESGYIRFPISDLNFSSEALNLQLGPHTLTDQKIVLKSDKNLPLGIDITLSEQVYYPVTALHPGIMGPFRFAPFMECYHGIHVVTSKAQGSVTIKGETYQLDDAKLYIEKDWGRSFPKEWIWLEASSFEEDDVHMMLSIANIPWIGKSFNGHLGYVWLGNIKIGLGTYRNSYFTLDEEGDLLTITVGKGKYHIVITAKQRMPIDLIAPSLGNMTRHMKEDLNGLITLEVYHDSVLIYQGASEFAGIERCGDIKALVRQEKEKK